MLLYACQHYVNSCMNIFIHKIFPMLIIYHTRATVATICTLSMIPAIGHLSMEIIILKLCRKMILFLLTDDDLQSQSLNTTQIC